MGQMRDALFFNSDSKKVPLPLSHDSNKKHPLTIKPSKLPRALRKSSSTLPMTNTRARLFSNRNTRRLRYVLTGNKIALVSMSRKKRAPCILQQDLKVVLHLLYLLFEAINLLCFKIEKGKRPRVPEQGRMELVSFSIRRNSSPQLLTRT